ncbi:SH3 domain-containing protein 21 isoform X2 [Rhinatrema bivittatum]|uniref:SH3 domain-containing protein 21 isoform X2 n=1 Tax=Rhinatrema bivittatum TaxID=194408 RepID=UPI0011297D80|nr:SH3 domain-containing protein 21 isoform X2 [Rhinatrema bivittatum]
MVEVLVLIDFQGQLEDELHIKAGDIVKNVRKSTEDGWLEGELNGKKGVFPKPFVKEIPASFMGDGGQKYPRSIRKPKVQAAKKQQRWCKASFPYNPEKPDELELLAGDTVEVLHEIEDGWWLGKKGVQIGAFPSNFVEELPAIPPETVPELDVSNWAGKQRPKLGDTTFIIKEAEKPKSKEKASANNQKGKEYCKVMFNYETALQDELALKKGDVVLILQKETEDEGWWEGELDGKTGLFPDNFVILLPPKSQKTDKPPARTLAIKGQAKPDQPVMEKKSADIGKPENKPSKDQKEPKDPKTQAPSKASHPPTKKAAPPPPIPAKVKPNFAISGRANEELQDTKPTEATKEKPMAVPEEKPKHPEENSFDAVLVSSSKLNHPTADRPKVQGKRPPTHPSNSSLPEENTSGLESKKEEAEEKAKVKAAAKGKDPERSAPRAPHAPSPGALQGKKTPAAAETKEKETVEELRAEVQTLRMLMEMMKTQHERDMADIKQEMKEEKVRRTALQTEIEKLKHLPPF